MGEAREIANSRRRLTVLAEKFRFSESGATAIEYGLIVALIFLAIVASINNFANSTSEMYNEIENALN